MQIFHSDFLARSQDDRDKATWSYVHERSTCPGCGTRPDEWLGPDGKPFEAYEAKQQVCRGCRAHEIAEEDRDDRTPKGTRIVLKRRPRGKQDA